MQKFGLERAKDLNAEKVLTYSLQNDAADIYGANIRMMNGSYEFDVMMKDRLIDNVKLNMGGMHNVENAIASIAVASSLKISNEKIREAVEAFRGVKRRFEYVLKNDRIVFIDDYAHHPEELRALITSAKTLFKGKQCTVIFQPHLFTRTRDLADGFAEVLDLADEVILMPIYPARELPIEGVSSQMIIERMKNRKKTVKSPGEIISWLKNEYINSEDGSVIITAGAGDIDTLVQPLKEILKETT